LFPKIVTRLLDFLEQIYGFLPIQKDASDNPDSSINLIICGFNAEQFTETAFLPGQASENILKHRLHGRFL
jgi:hypothetical protein